MISMRGARNAAREIDQKPEDELAHRRDEAGARLGDENPRPARSLDVDIADVDGAAQERAELRQALEHRGRPGRLAVGDDEIAVRRGGNQLFALR